MPLALTPTRRWVLRRWAVVVKRKRSQVPLWAIRTLILLGSPSILACPMFTYSVLVRRPP